MTETEDARPREIARAVDRIRPILAGRPPEMQGAILAELLATWLSGHYTDGDEGDEAATRKLRAELLAMHSAGVLVLLEHQQQEHQWLVRTGRRI